MGRCTICWGNAELGLLRELFNFWPHPFKLSIPWSILSAFFFLSGAINSFLVLRLRKKGSFKDCVLYVSQNAIKYILKIIFNPVMWIWKITLGLQVLYINSETMSSLFLWQRTVIHSFISICSFSSAYCFDVVYLGYYYAFKIVGISTPRI